MTCARVWLVKKIKYIEVHCRKFSCSCSMALLIGIILFTKLAVMRFVSLLYYYFKVEKIVEIFSHCVVTCLICNMNDLLFFYLNRSKITGESRTQVK